MPAVRPYFLSGLLKRALVKRALDKIDIGRLSGAMPRRPNNSRQTRILLTALLERPGTWRHGYDLSKETGLRSGTLYPLLMRLSEQGLLEQRWQDAERPGLPPRHVYRLTASGVALARDQELAAAASTGREALA